MNIIIKNILILIVFSNLSLIFIWICKNHPYQYVFFNNLIKKKNISQNFDLDYWGLSYKNIIEKILEVDKKNKINIINISENNLFYPLFSITKEQRDRFIIVEDLKIADYVTTNYFIEDKKLRSQLNNLEFKIIYQIKIDGEPINTLYKNMTRLN